MDKSENNMNNLPEENEEQVLEEVVETSETSDAPENAEEPKAKSKKKKDEEEYCPSIFDKPDYSYEKRKKERKISKQTLTIIVSLIVCVALGFGAWGVFKLIPGDDVTPTDSESSEEMTDEKHIYDYSHYISDFSDDKEIDTYPELSGTEGYQKGLTLGGISRIDVKNQNDTFVLTPDYYTRMEMNTETMEDEEVTTLEWYMNSIEGVNISDVTFDTDYNKFVVQDLLKLPYNSVYAENKNDKIADGSMTYLEECGLDNPVASPSITFKDGSKLTVLVGEETPVKGQYYVTVIGEAADNDLLGKPVKDNKIYITEFANIAFYLKEADYYVELDLIDAVENETTYDENGDEIADEYFVMGEMAGFDSLKITGRNTDGTITFKVVDPSVPPYTTMYLMTSPRKQCGDVDAMATLLTPVSNGFRAEGCVTMKATYAQKEEYGINNPLYQVTYVVKGVTNVLTVGNKITTGDYAGSYFVMVNNNPSLFIASADVLQFITYKSIDYTTDKIFASEIGVVDSLLINVKGKQYNFDLIHGETNDDLVVKLDGKTVNTEKFRELYIAILSVDARGDNPHVTDAKNTNEELGLTFKYVDYSYTDKISFYQYTDRRYSCLLNGSGDWSVYSTSIENVIKALDEVVK